MNKKGQALAEFIMILPILLIILMSVVDIGSIYIKRYDLDKDLDTVTTLYENNKQDELINYMQKENISFDEEKQNNLVTITVKKDIKINAPILSSIIGKTYTIKAKRTIIGDKNE